MVANNNDEKTLKKDRNPGKWVLIWEYSARAFQWIPTWQGLDNYQKSLRPCTLDEISLGIGRVKLVGFIGKTMQFRCEVAISYYELCPVGWGGKSCLHIPVNLESWACYINPFMHIYSFSNVIWIQDTFGNNLAIKRKITVWRKVAG